MKARLIVTVISIIMSSCCWALPQLKVQNDQLVDNTGRVVFLHGLNEMDKQPPYEPSAIGFDERSIQFIADHGFNVVRLGIFWAAIEPTPNHYNDAYLANIKKTIQLLAKHHIYTLIDFHQDGFSSKDSYGAGEPVWATLGTGSKTNPGFPMSYYGGLKFGKYTIGKRLDDNFSKFWADTYSPAANEGLQESYYAMVAHTVSYFGDMPSIIGYEVMNEPFVGNDWASCFKSATHPQPGCQKFESTTLNQFSTHVSYAIHRANPQAITWFEPDLGFGLSNPTYIGRLNDTNIGFSFHDYNGKNPVVPINNALAEQKIAHVPLVMTEFGAALASADQLATFMNLADKQQLSWIEWAYTNNPDIKFAHLPGKPEPDPKDEGIVYDAKKPLTGTNVKWDRLNALTRIYPEFVAGQDIKFSYNSKTKVFVLSYTAVPGGVTEIMTPQLKNTTYVAYAVGAKKLSAPDSTTAPGVIRFENEVTTQQGHQVIITLKVKTNGTSQ